MTLPTDRKQSSPSTHSPRGLSKLGSLTPMERLVPIRDFSYRRQSSLARIAGSTASMDTVDELASRTDGEEGVTSKNAKFSYVKGGNDALALRISEAPASGP